MRKWKRQFGIVAALTLSAALLAVGCGSSAEPNEAAAVDSSDTAQAGSDDLNVKAQDDASSDAEADTAVVEEKTEDKQNESENAQEAKAEDVKKEEETQTSSDSLFSEVSSEGFSAENAIKGKKSSLPAYEYPGPEQFYYELYKYIIDNFGKQYLPGDVCIPCPIIVAEDDSNKDDMLLYGNFEVYNYTLSGDTLMTVSGGSHPGCIHYKMGDNGYEITGFDQVADGSDYDSTAKEIFGDKYDAFIKASSDNKAREEVRAQIISNYAAANNLSITGFQDYGWEKIALPTENIDSFYSTLD
ncbi:MAG: hypothetical protein E7306_10370 [Butyrivibrio sp.]|nr:hypothetical protein [Butyrivibrio sp.]